MLGDEEVASGDNEGQDSLASLPGRRQSASGNDPAAQATLTPINFEKLRRERVGLVIICLPLIRFCQLAKQDQTIH
jgi:hypothetical protein